MKLDSTIIRWIFLVPVTWAAWYTAVFLGIAILAAGEAFCPAGRVVSGWCNANWYSIFESVVIFSSSLSAIFVVMVGSYMAPTHRSFVAKLVFITGSAVAIFMATETQAYLALAGTLVCGLGSLWVVVKRWGRASAK